MKKSIFKTRNPRKGVSMLELVISLVVITVVSASAVSIIVSSSANEAETVNRLYMQTAVENTAECFYFAETPAHFGELLVNQLGYDNGSSAYYYSYGEYTIEVSVQTLPENANYLKSITIKVSRTGETDLTYTYTKG